MFHHLVKNSEITDTYYQERSPGGEGACAILEENYIVRTNFLKYGGFLLSCENSYSRKR